MRIFVFFACLSLALAFSPGCLNEGKSIVGGIEAPLKSRPYQVALFNTPNGGFYSFSCAGVLISPRWVLTASHCGGLYAGFGYHDLNVKQQIIKGKWYRHPTHGDDIALIHLDAPATLSDAVQPIKLASAGSDISGGEELLVSGWGSLSSGGYYPAKLRQVVLCGVSRSSCSTAYGLKIANFAICAAAPGKDSCQGDSGGPIVSNFDENRYVNSTTLEGIVSWGYGCADPRYPGVYTRVSFHCSWIAKITSNEVTCKVLPRQHSTALP
ncbi:trypsin alpha-3-like [Acanthaster planci]|uniref:Trypsin alpha-3-like n=1 Tax=Acanthaster planci TaxID=133434 RepID=A0A8B7YDP7_ACAPL|nr:trypsin alpha-3-like [Acanthaster planci]